MNRSLRWFVLHVFVGFVVRLDLALDQTDRQTDNARTERKHKRRQLLTNTTKEAPTMTNIHTNERPPTKASPTQSPKEQRQPIVLDQLELFWCFCLCSVGHLVLIAHKLGLLPSNERPIPAHSLSSAQRNSHVPNMVHNETYRGDTVSDKALVLSAVIVFAVQM